MDASKPHQLPQIQEDNVAGAQPPLPLHSNVPTATGNGDIGNHAPPLQVSYNQLNFLQDVKLAFYLLHKNASELPKNFTYFHNSEYF